MKSKKLFVLVLSLIMVLSMSYSVFAGSDGGSDGYAQGGNVEENGARISISKQLQVGQGIDVSVLPTFTFTATPGATEASGETAYVTPGASDSIDAYPALSFPGVKFANGDRKDASDELLVRESIVDLSGLTFKHAGLYAWTITEDQTDSDVGGGTLTSNVGNKSYVLRVYIKNGEKGPEVATTTLAPTGSSGDKLNADPTDEVDTTSDGTKPVKNTDGNGFVFVNKFVKNVTQHEDPTETGSDGKPTVEDGAFVLTKAVLGEGGNLEYPFSFKVKVTLPSTAKNFALANDFEDDTEKAVTLKDGQNLTFGTLPAGTVIEVTEDTTGTENYNTTYNGAQTVIDSTTFVAKSEQLEGSTKTPTVPAQGSTLNGGMAKKTLVVGDKGAFIDVTNAFCDGNVTPTGIVINNLPYVLLIGLALGGIVLFSRKKRYE